VFASSRDFATIDEVGAPATQVPRPASAAWWVNRGRFELDRRPRKDGLTLERIISVAIGIVQRDGHAALTMRRVADELGTGAASLYRHIDGREDLLALVVDHVVGAVPPAEPPPGHWRTNLEWMARRFRAHLLAQQAFVPLITSAQLLGPNSMRGREAVLSLLIAAGFRPEDAVRTQLTLQHFVISTVAAEVRAEARTPDECRHVRDLFAGLDPERYRTVVAHADVLAAHRTEDEFEFGLQAILDGVEALRRGNEEH
jgi:AcrR family transcriptional regulator